MFLYHHIPWPDIESKRLVEMNKVDMAHLLILEVVVCDVIQLREETSIGGVLGAVEDALEDGLVLRIDVVVLQDTEDVGQHHSTLPRVVGIG